LTEPIPDGPGQGRVAYIEDLLDEYYQVRGGTGQGNRPKQNLENLESKGLSMFKPEGVFAVMLTPFTKTGDVSEQELRRMVDFLVDAGVHGLFPLGSAGESVHLSREEKVRTMRIIVDQARGRVPVTPGVGSTHPQESIFLATAAKEMGCAGLVVAPPYYYPFRRR